MSSNLNARSSAYYYVNTSPWLFDAHCRMFGQPESWLETLNGVVITGTHIRDAYATIRHIDGDDDEGRLQRGIILFSYANERSILPIEKSGYALYERVLALRRWVKSSKVERVLNAAILYEVAASAALVEIDERIELDPSAFGVVSG